MMLFVFTSVVIIIFFISMINYYFQRSRYKYATEEEKSKLSILESPSTWSIFTFISGFILLIAIIFAIGNMTGGFSNVQKTQDTINQYQNDSSTQSDSTDQSDSTN